MWSDFLKSWFKKKNNSFESGKMKASGDKIISTPGEKKKKNMT